MTDELVRERRDNVLVARINRPEARNALNPEVMAGISRAVVEAETDPEIRVLVLTGTGDRAFCAGMDLRSIASGAALVADPAAMEGFHRLMAGEVTVPVVGAANASVLAGGFELLLGCDVIVASSEAKFGLPEVKRGLFPAGIGMVLGMRVPQAIALEIVLTGDAIDAARAYELGLVNQIVAPEQVLDAAVALAQRIAANAPLGLAAAKELVRLAPIDFGRAKERLRELQTSVFASHDAKEGATAFVEKRAPVWQGR